MVDLFKIIRYLIKMKVLIGSYISLLRAQYWWQRWSNEFLLQLQRLHKWRNDSRNVQTDHIVLVTEDTIVTNIWPLARVVSTYPGRDGKTRVFSIKSKNGIYKRPITK